MLMALTRSPQQQIRTRMSPWMSGNCEDDHGLKRIMQL